MAPGIATFGAPGEQGPFRASTAAVGPRDPVSRHADANQCPKVTVTVLSIE